MTDGTDKLKLRDIILGGQDGLVNVLGVTLGIAAASGDTRLVLAGGLAATFAESFSMAAVAYTSTLTGDRALLSSAIVGGSAVLGSFVPLVPFFLLPVAAGIWVSLLISSAALFVLGVYKAKFIKRNLWKSGLEIATIGVASAIIGYAVGVFFRAPA